MRLLLSILFMILSFLSIVSCNNKVTKTRQADLVVEYNGTKIAASGPSWTSYDELIRDLDNDEKTFILFAATWCRPCGRVLKIAKQEGWLKKIKVINADVNWVQYFMQESGINSIPSMIVVDKDGSDRLIVGPSKIVTYLVIHL